MDHEWQIYLTGYAICMMVRVNDIPGGYTYKQFMRALGLRFWEHALPVGFAPEKDQVGVDAALAGVPCDRCTGSQSLFNNRPLFSASVRRRAISQ